MIKLSIFERIVISAILTLAVFISCLIYNIDICSSITFGLGSIILQTFDHIVAYYRFDRK